MDGAITEHALNGNLHPFIKKLFIQIPGFFFELMICMQYAAHRIHIQTIDETKHFFFFMFSVIEKFIRAENQNNCFCVARAQTKPFSSYYSQLTEFLCGHKTEKKKHPKQNQIGGVTLLYGYFCGSVHS